MTAAPAADPGGVAITESRKERLPDAVYGVRSGKVKRQAFDKIVHANYKEKEIQLSEVEFSLVEQHTQNFLRHPDRREFFTELTISKTFDPPTGTRGSVIDWRLAPANQKKNEIWKIVLRPEVLEIPEVYRLYIDLDNDDQKCLQLQTYQLPAKVAENKQYFKEAEARAKAKGETYDTALEDFIETGCGKKLTADQIESLTNWHNKGIFKPDSFGFKAARKHIMEEKTPSPVWSFMENKLDTAVANAVSPSLTVGTMIRAHFGEEWSASPKTYQQVCKYLNTCEPTAEHQEEILEAIDRNVEYSTLLAKNELNDEERKQAEHLATRLKPQITQASAALWPDVEAIAKIKDEGLDMKVALAEFLVNGARLASIRKLEDRGTKLKLAQGRFEIRAAHKPRNVLDSCKGRVCKTVVGEGESAAVKRVIVDKMGSNCPGNYQNYLVKSVSMGNLSKLIDAHRGKLMENCRKVMATSDGGTSSSEGTDTQGVAEKPAQDLFVRIDGADVYEKDFEKFVGQDSGKKMKLVKALFNNDCKPLHSKAQLYPTAGRQALQVLSIGMKPGDTFYQTSTLEALTWEDSKKYVASADRFDEPTLEMLKETECTILEATGQYSGLNTVKIWLNSTHHDNEKRAPVVFRTHMIRATTGLDGPDAKDLQQFLDNARTVASLEKKPKIAEPKAATSTTSMKKGTKAKVAEPKAAAPVLGTSSSSSSASAAGTVEDEVEKEMLEEDETTSIFVILLPYIEVDQADEGGAGEGEDGEGEATEGENGGEGAAKSGKGLKKAVAKDFDALFG
eukprot:g12107.t1